MKYDPDTGRTWYFIKRVNNFKFQVGFLFLLKIHVIFSPQGRHWLKSEPTQQQPKDVHISKQRAEGFGQVPGAGGSTSSGIIGVYFGMLVRGWGHPAWPGRSPTSEGIGERKESFFPREVLEHPGAPTLCGRGGCGWGAAINTTFKKGKIQKVERKGKHLKAWGLKPHSTSLISPLNHGQCLWSLHTSKIMHF